MSEKIMVHIPMHLTPEHYLRVGEIAARWSWLEWQFHAIIRTILGLGKKEGRILTIGMGIKPMSNMIRGLSMQLVKDKKLKLELQRLAKDVAKAKADRDTYVHGVYCHPDGKPNHPHIYHMRSTEERIMPNAEPLPLTKLDAVIGNLRHCQDRAQDLTTRLKALPRKRD
jgi:hypothetical protein